MSWQDIVNGIYEIGGGLFMIWNCYKLYKDKDVKGLSLVSSAFFSTWSFWNIYYYPSLNQIVSLCGAILLSITNVIWMIMALYYVNKKP
jgi:uncharacterized membrane protein YfcA